MKPPGQYILRESVKNPKPDRRSRYDWRDQELWPAGMEFTINETLTAIDTKALEIHTTWGRWSHQCLYLYDTEDRRVLALLGALEPAPRTGERDLKALLGDTVHRMPFRIIARLLDEKVLDIDQVKATVAAIDADDEADAIAADELDVVIETFLLTFAQGACIVSA